MCGVGSLSDDSGDAVDIKPSDCNCWGCDRCGPKRRARVELEARLGQPDRILTLTSKPLPDSTPTERRRFMGKQWAVLRKRMQRRTGNPVEFNAFVEETQRGEPHFHILLRGVYVDQAILSQWWEELTGCPIVDIRRFKTPKQAARYVAKYLGKGLHKFGNCKRYWKSKGWVLPDPTKTDEPAWEPRAWRYSPQHPDDMVRDYIGRGYWLVPDWPVRDVRRLIPPPWIWRPPPTAPPERL